MTTGKAIALIMWTSGSKVMPLLFNILSRFVIAFLPRSKSLLISWLQSPSAVILETKKMKKENLFHSSFLKFSPPPPNTCAHIQNKMNIKTIKILYC